MKFIGSGDNPIYLGSNSVVSSTSEATEKKNSSNLRKSMAYNKMAHNKLKSSYSDSNLETTKQDLRKSQVQLERSTSLPYLASSKAFEVIGQPTNLDKVAGKEIERQIKELQKIVKKIIKNAKNCKKNDLEEQSKQIEDIKMRLIPLQYSDLKLLGETYSDFKSLPEEMRKIESQFNHIQSRYKISKALEKCQTILLKDEIFSLSLEDKLQLHALNQNLLTSIADAVNGALLVTKKKKRTMLKNLLPVTSKNAAQILKITHPGLSKFTEDVLAKSETMQPTILSVFPVLSAPLARLNEGALILDKKMISLEVRIYSLSSLEQKAQISDLIVLIENLQDEFNEFKENNNDTISNLQLLCKSSNHSIKNEALQLISKINNREDKLKYFMMYLKETMQSGTLNADLMDVCANEMKEMDGKNKMQAKKTLALRLNEFIANEDTFNQQLKELKAYKNELEKIVNNPEQLKELQIDVSIDEIKKFVGFFDSIDQQFDTNSDFLNSIINLSFNLEDDKLDDDKFSENIQIFVINFLTHDFSSFINVHEEQRQFIEFYENKKQVYDQLFNKIKAKNHNNFNNQKLNIEAVISTVVQRMTRYPLTLKELSKEAENNLGEKSALSGLINQAYHQSLRLARAIDNKKSL
jgi:hypothetical protein